MLQGFIKDKNNMLHGRQILIRPEFVLMSLRKVSSIILFLCITVSLHAEISFFTDEEAILYVNLTEGDAILDTILLFREEDGTFIEQQTIPLSE